jgi:DNA ligase (NAD+)
LTSVAVSKEQSFARVLFSLGIRHVGESVARVISNHFRSWDTLYRADLEAMGQIDGVGPEIGLSLRSYMDQPRNQKFLRKLVRAGLCFESEEVVGQKLEGQSFVLTGSLPHLSRMQAKGLIHSEGGRIVASISSKTNYVVVGENPGTKLAKARSLGIKEINERQLQQLAAGQIP